MEIHLYNTLSRQKEVFQPLQKGRVGIYNCGPTVYDTPHIGNYRTFIMDDIVRRVFEYNSYAVHQVMNVTDVDDKMIRRSREDNIPLKELAEKYERAFLADLSRLNILVPTHLIRATDHIGDMVAIVQDLLDKGFAYKASDGVYMSVEKVPDYGRLANLTAKDASSAQERISNDDYDKENPHDFALWKFAVPEDGGAHWPAPYGEGRPGWHIECSAMSMKYLGSTLDIHTGAVDLIFPHHTNEIAQSESATGRQYVRYWLHGAFMNVSNEKMAKSKGNFLKLDDLVENGISPLAYRYWLVTAHYRSPVNFTVEAVKAAQTALIRLMRTVAEYPKAGRPIAEYRDRFNKLINDDLNMPGAMALVWELIGDATVTDASKRATILDFDRVFGLGLESVPEQAQTPIPPEIAALAEAREEARHSRDWKKADALRTEIENRGFTISDGPSGMKISPKDE